MGGGVSKQRCRPRDPPLTDRTLHPSLHRRIGRKGAWAMQRPTDDEKRARSLMLTSQLVAGGGAGAITKTSIAPLERIKILMRRVSNRRICAMADCRSLQWPWCK